MLDSDVRQQHSKVMFARSTLQQLRLPGALQTPPTQRYVRDESDTTTTKTRKHKRSFSFVCRERSHTPAMEADNIHKTTNATTPPQ